MKHPMKHRRKIAKSLEGYAERQREREATRARYVANSVSYPLPVRLGWMRNQPRKEPQ